MESKLSTIEDYFTNQASIYIHFCNLDVWFPKVSKQVHADISAKFCIYKLLEQRKTTKSHQNKHLLGGESKPGTNNVAFIRLPGV